MTDTAELVRELRAFAEMEAHQAAQYQYDHAAGQHVATRAADTIERLTRPADTDGMADLPPDWEEAEDGSVKIVDSVMHAELLALEALTRPAAPLDEVRMREILAEELARIKLNYSAAWIRGEKKERHLMVMEGLNAALAAMSRAVSEARAEQKELDAKIAGYFAEIYWGLSPAKSAAAATAAAIRSQNDPDEQGE